MMSLRDEWWLPWRMNSRLDALLFWWLCGSEGEWRVELVAIEDEDYF